MKPFLKWAGGKYRLMPELRKYFPTDGKRFVDPFLGSGAVSLNVDYPSILAGDVNEALVQTWTALKTQKIEFIGMCKSLFTPENNTPEAYARLRDEFNDPTNNQRAELFVYLNRHCFNGLCRFNKKGKFNVPFGKYTKPYFPENEMLHAVEVSNRMEIIKGDFRDVFAQVREGDVVYADPPYVPASETASFTSYSAGGFTMTDQRDLRMCAWMAMDRGATVIISNSCNMQTMSLYQDAQLEFINVQRNISCKGTTRTKAKELIAIYKK